MPPVAQERRVVLPVSGMHCASCVAKVEKAVGALEGVREVSADLQHAKIYVSVMGTPKEQDLCLHGLRHSAGFIQSKLANRLKTRFTPVITFVLDEGVKKSIEVSRLINEALAQSAPKVEEEPADGIAEEESES